MTDEIDVRGRPLDLDALSIDELRELYRMLPGTIRAREAADRAARIERVLAEAKAQGMTRDEIRALRSTLTSSEKKRAPRKSARTAHYRDPDTGATWSGKGRKPAWIKAHEDQHGSLDALKVE